ncbi:MAG: hypothetical protein KC912_22860 [Proteobacteria bacterium]|nr:hypothetical protein [Pseudomonadota bacterium]
MTIQARLGEMPGKYLSEVAREDPDVASWASESKANREQLEAIRAEVVSTAMSRSRSFGDFTSTDALMHVLYSLPRVHGVLVSFGEAYTAQDAVGELRARSGGRRGWIYCSEQDLEAAVQGSGLNLGFSDRATAEFLCEQLEAQGVPYWWPGDESLRVFVPIRWERRLPKV